MSMTPRKTVASALAFALAAATVGCELKPATRVQTEKRRLAVPTGVSLSQLTVSPADAVVRRRESDGVLELETTRPVSVTSEVTCPSTTETANVALAAVIEAPAAMAAVGWSTHVRLEVKEQCAEARGGTISWSVIEGAVASLTVAPDGRAIDVVTVAAPQGPLPWGVVPLSPRTRGAARLAAEWRSSGGATLVRHVDIAAMPRATGIPSIARGQDVLLSGTHWTLVRAIPKEAAMTLSPIPGRSDLSRFRASTTGQFVFMSAEGALSIRAGLHEEVPLDCGRSDCHAETARAAQTSAMTHVLRNGLEGDLGPLGGAPCALACHAVGEPGLLDHGFVDRLAALGASLPSAHRGAWDELPRTLRRLGGVGCTSCHGPAAIPEPTARFAVLRSDVCATCHDAPPRYGHVAAWQKSAMSHADLDPEAATKPECQRCHTTAGFLRSLSAARREDPPASARPVGIACAACHAPHGPHGAHLVRDVTLAPVFASLDGPSRICVPCHEGDAATVWAGRPSEPSPHKGIGCVGCHMANHEHGASHRFEADMRQCRTCHKEAPRRPSTEATPRPRTPASRPAHASGNTLVRTDEARLEAAIREDRAAWVHNPGLAAHFGAERSAPRP